MITAIVFLPLFGALFAGLFCRHIAPRTAEVVTSGCLVISAILSGIVFHNVVIEGNPQTVELLNWISVGGFEAVWALRVDQLTAVMLVVVTWVSSVVHIYSIGYMHHDNHIQRFFAYLSLFTFFMLILVTADNFLQLFVGWEGVGLCSYLLIGFWFKKPSANAAAIKAFLVNRVGDFGFALGIFAVFVLFESIDFDTVFAAAPEMTGATLSILGMEFHALTLITMLLFIGAMGKSAQIGLHTWLPDAMEGPTPVSALIHAATMVTAGVFLVVRCSPLFELSPDTLTVVTVVGATTAFFAATIGLCQNDIKKVIAYSTCSQLGYMFFVCGIGAYAAAVFHLMTHAFFKALLFLGSGSVIHAVADEQDMRKMGGLRKHMKWTYTYMWIGSLALAGMGFAGIGFAGYYSKDLILEAAFAADTPVAQYAFYMGIAAAFLTAFYSWRLINMTFHGTPRAPREVMEKVHEAPLVMNLPLLLLVAGALFSGYIGKKMLGMVDQDGTFWGDAIYRAADNTILEQAYQVPQWVVLLPIAVGLIGIVLAYVFYLYKPALPGKVAGAVPGVYRFLLNKWYFDELYDFVFVRGAKNLGTHLWKFWDVRVVDGLGPNGFARMTQFFAGQTSRLQTGYVYHYAFAMLVGLVGLISWFVLRGGLP